MPEKETIERARSAKRAGKEEAVLSQQALARIAGRRSTRGGEGALACWSQAGSLANSVLTHRQFWSIYTWSMYTRSGR